MTSPELSHSLSAIAVSRHFGVSLLPDVPAPLALSEAQS
jgi:hypothetical protein